MSKSTKELDVDLIDPEDMTEDEHRFLQDRGMLPAGVDPLPVVFKTHTGSVVSNDPMHYAKVRAAEEADWAAQMEDQVNERARAMAEEMVRDQMHGQMAAPDDQEYHGDAVVLPNPPKGVVEETGGLTPGTVRFYKEWEPDEIDAELDARGLATDGNKRDKIRRLVTDDRTKAGETGLIDDADVADAEEPTEIP